MHAYAWHGIHILDEMHGILGQVWANNRQQVVCSIRATWKYTVVGPSGITSTMTVFASIGWASLLHSFFKVCFNNSAVIGPCGVPLSHQPWLGVSGALFVQGMFTTALLFGLLAYLNHSNLCSCFLGIPGSLVHSLLAGCSENWVTHCTFNCILLWTLIASMSL